MNIVSQFKNLKNVAKKLKRRRLKRVREILKDYGLRELLRRVKAKMRYGDVNTNRDAHIITNESYVKNQKRLSRMEMEQRLSFVLLPGSFNVSKVEIATRCHSKGASLSLEIADLDGNVFLQTQTDNVADNQYTTFDFLPVLEVISAPSYQPQKLRFTIVSNRPDCGVLIDRRRRKPGFDVSGGGYIACRIYARPDAHYIHWLKNNTPTPEEYQAQRDTVFPFQPKFSILVPLYNTPEPFLRQMLLSVKDQTYSNWELCLADGSDDSVSLAPIVQAFADPRIKYKKLEKNQGISENTNQAIAMATGAYIALLDHDDTLAPHALYRNAELLNQDSSYEFIYSDEDKLSEDGAKRFDPFFKPDFSPDTLNAFNYITHFAVIKKSLLEKVGGFDSAYNGAQDYDLFLRATEQAKKVGHIDDILYHWRVAETSTAYSSATKEYTVNAGKAALEAAVARKGAHARVELGVLPNYYNLVYEIPVPHPLISIIIPNYNAKSTLKKCVDSILSKTTYDNYEIIIAENNSDDEKLFSYYQSLRQDPRFQIVEWNHPFNFSALNNHAARYAKGDLLLFLNNDMTVISPDWLEQMAMHACRADIGAVGAKLFYPDDTLQHGGIILRIGGVAGHSHKFADKDDVGSFARMVLVHNVSAVTAACLMTRKDVFQAAGGFDEQFAVAYNDVDFCLKIRDLGYSIVWTPYARLYHYESKTRGYEDTPEKIKRLEREAELWHSKWDAKYPCDPFYNRNLSHIFQDYSVNPERIVRF